MPSAATPSNLLQEQHEEVALNPSTHGQFDFSLCRRNDALLGTFKILICSYDHKYVGRTKCCGLLYVLCQRASECPLYDGGMREVVSE